jgi:hypothetical protein
MADLEIGPLDRRRRGLSIGAFLVWMLIAAAAGAVGWGIYGNEVSLTIGVRSGSDAVKPERVRGHGAGK